MLYNFYNMCLEIRDAMQIIKTILFRSENKSYKKEATMKLTSPSTQSLT